MFAFFSRLTPLAFHSPCHPTRYFGFGWVISACVWFVCFARQSYGIDTCVGWDLELGRRGICRWNSAVSE
jgi:hypothetical protein